MKLVFLRYPEGRGKAVTFSYDDGCQADKRLVKIFTKHGVKATFNLNSVAAREVNLTDEELRELFLDNGHEIAVHGEFHRANGNIRTIEGIKEVLSCRLELERRCGRIIRGMAYPNSGITRMGNLGTYGEIKNYLTELDIAYARTLGGDNNSFTLPSDFHAWMPSAHHSNPKTMELVDEFLSIDVETQHHNNKYPRLLYIWGHAYEFDNDNNWELIEEICEKLTADKDIWFATNIEIYDYVTAYKRLIYSADGHKIYNPSVIKLWLDIDGVSYSVAPGETVTIAD